MVLREAEINLIFDRCRLNCCSLHSTYSKWAPGIMRCYFDQILAGHRTSYQDRIFIPWLTAGHVQRQASVTKLIAIAISIYHVAIKSMPVKFPQPSSLRIWIAEIYISIWNSGKTIYNFRFDEHARQTFRANELKTMGEIAFYFQLCQRRQLAIVCARAWVWYLYCSRLWSLYVKYFSTFFHPFNWMASQVAKRLNCFILRRRTHTHTQTNAIRNKKYTIFLVKSDFE